MKRTLATVFFALFCQACAAGGESHDVICYKKVSAHSDWTAVEFIDSAGKLHRVAGDTIFTPVQRLKLDRGKASAQTWGGEILPAQVRIEAGKVFVEPRYLDWLGATTPIGMAAKQVVPFANPSVSHRMKFAASCSASDPLVIEITSGAGNAKNRRLLGTVTLREKR